MYNLKLQDPNFLPHIGCQVELSLAPGEAMAIVGENGLGKTTLMQRFYSAQTHNMSMVEQNPMDLFYDRTLRTFKNIFIKSCSSLIDEEFFLNCWEKFGLSKKEDRLLSTLSGGEGQALKICLGLAPKTDIYLLDEPSQYLDDVMKMVLSYFIQELMVKQKSILMVEHDLNWQKFSIKVTQLEINNRTLIRGKEWIT